MNFRDAPPPTICLAVNTLDQETTTFLDGLDSSSDESGQGTIMGWEEYFPGGEELPLGFPDILRPDGTPSNQKKGI